MEGSGSGSGRKVRSTTTSSPPPPSSICDLFGGERSARGTSGGLFGSLGNSNSNSSSIFTRQTHEDETVGSESTNHNGTGAQRSSNLGHLVAKASQGLNGSNSQKGQGHSGSLHGRSQNVNDTFLGSSLYYGGPDLCCDPSTTKTDSLLGMKKDNTEDDTNPSNMGASRGNWWQGSLYY